MSKLVLFTSFEFANVHLKKDVGLFPLFLKQYFDEVEICYVSSPKNEVVLEQWNGIKITKIGNIKTLYGNKFSLIQDFFIWKKIKHYLKKNESITHVMLFHFLFTHFLWCYKLKKLLPNLKIYLKMDMNEEGATKFFDNINSKGFKRILKNHIFKNGMSSIDLMTCETVAGHYNDKKNDCSRRLF